MTKDVCSADLDKPVEDNIKDSFERRINYLRVSITDRCNLRCLYCMPVNGINQINHKDILRYEELLRIIRISAKNGIDKVRITGGEPLVRKGVVDFIKDVASIEGLKDLGLTTNGTMLKSMAEDIYNAGLTRVNISIDSLKPETYNRITRNDSLKRVIAGLEEVSRVGFNPIKINVVVVRGINDDEVVDFAKLTQKFPYTVRFIEYMPIGEDSFWNKKLFVPSDEIKGKIDAYKKLEPVEKVDKSSPATNYRLPGADGIIGFISPLSRHFCSLCNRIRLTADGKLRSCLFSENEIDLKNTLRSDTGDEEISKIILRSIQGKPEGYGKIKSKNDKKRSMHSIGG